MNPPLSNAPPPIKSFGLKLGWYPSLLRLLSREFVYWNPPSSTKSKFYIFFFNKTLYYKILINSKYNNTTLITQTISINIYNIF
jgi:hypothetical protein